jgi:hypothetical protein
MEFKMKSVLIYFAIFISCNCFAGPLASDSSETKQLIAMGYDLREDAKKTVTIAKISDYQLVLDKNEEQLTVSRNFKRKKLDQKQEFELLQIINNFNKGYSLQFMLYEDSVSASLHLFGRHDPKSFAKVIKLLDNIETILETQPKIYELVNN